jgi:uncharacterized protein YaaR (DUF327 family)
MVDQSIAQNEDKTKYVHLEMILNKEAKYDVVAGLFKGIMEREGEKFILLHGLKESTNVLNLKFYNIMTVEQLADDYKNMTFLTAEDTDQVLALELVESLYEGLVAAGNVLENDPKIIDIRKYEGVPKEYLEGKPLEKDTTTSSVSSNGSYTPPCTRYSGTGVTYTKTVVKKDPEPTLLSRTNSKKPAKTALDLMEEKITQIMAGTFVPVLPETVGEDADGKAAADDPDTDTDYYGGGMHGAWGMC